MRSRDTHGCHNALDDNGSWSIMVDDLDETTPEGVDVLSLGSHNLETVTCESLGDVIPFEVLGRMTGNGDIVVVYEEFYVEVLSDCQSSSLCIVALLLGSIRTQAEHGFVTVGESNAVNHGPHVSKTPRGEFDSGGQTQLGVTGKLGVGSTVVEKVIGSNGALKSGE